MKPLTFLVLTDHSGHSDQNSVYALVNTLVADARTARVDVASRGDARNAAFFAGGGAQVQGLHVREQLNFDPTGRQFTEAEGSFAPADYDVIWLRLPHPIDPAFFSYLKNIAPAAPPLVVNDPEGIEETGNKSFLTNFPDFTPPVRMVSGEREIRAFAAEFPIVLKPLRAYGGQGIVRIDGQRVWRETEEMQLDDFLESVDEDYLAMKFLKNVSQGDKRILVVNGTILAASLRLPAAGEWLCNVAQGGRSVGAEIEIEERKMVDAVAPVLLSHGICFFGMDTLVNDEGKRVLSELNTLSIGGFPQSQAQTGRPILQQAIDELLNYCYARL